MINMSFSKIEVLSVLFGLLIVGFVAFSNNGGISVKSTPEQPSVIAIENTSLVVEGGDGADGVRGANGANGANGARGADGFDGANGVRGANGADGADGQGSLQVFIP